MLPQLGQGVTKDLTYAPLGQLQGFAELFEGKALVTVESRDELLAILEPTYGVDNLGTHIHKIHARLGIDHREVLDECTTLYPPHYPSPHLCQSRLPERVSYWFRKPLAISDSET